MRTIKFKAKRLDNDEWLEGYYRGNYEGKAFISRIKRPPLLFEVDPSTVCQFTGFLDKNGKEIYEGDVLRTDIYPFSCVGDDEYDNYYGTIGWSEFEASFYIVAIKNPKSSVRGLSDGICESISQKFMRDFEVVGSIHDKEWQEKLNLKKNKI